MVEERLQKRMVRVVARERGQTIWQDFGFYTESAGYGSIGFRFALLKVRSGWCVNAEL